MQWYYLSDSFERIPMSEAQFTALAARGILRPATPVWRKGMADWTACGEVKPEIFAAGVHRGSDENNPAAGSAAIHGTIIGLSRALASYNPWLRILGVVLIVIATGVFSLLGWESWNVLEFGVDEWKKGHVFLERLLSQVWVVWALLAFQAVSASLTFWCGLLLLRSAARAKRAMESGDERILTSAIHDTGRYFLITALVTIFGIILWLGVWLWVSRTDAFPAPPSPAEKRVTI
jgi:hypothetical protein